MVLSRSLPTNWRVFIVDFLMDWSALKIINRRLRPSRFLTSSKRLLRLLVPHPRATSSQSCVTLPAVMLRHAYRRKSVSLPRFVETH